MRGPAPHPELLEVLSTDPVGFAAHIRAFVQGVEVQGLAATAQDRQLLDRFERAAATLEHCAPCEAACE